MRIVLAPFIAILLFAGPSAAKRDYVDDIPNGGVNSCDNCHDNKTDDFHDDWDRLGWGKKLAGKDSDGDGFTNGEELGDPRGQWGPGDPDPGDARLVSNPGSRKSIPRVAGAPSEKKAKCIRTLNHGLSRVAAAAGVALHTCVEEAATGTSEAAPDLCVDEVATAGIVDRSIEKLQLKEEKHCLSLKNLPAFGATSAAEVAAAAVEERMALLRDLLGDDLDTAIRLDADDEAGARCQEGLLETTDACFSLALEDFETCKAEGLETRRIGGIEDLESCLARVRSGKRNKKCGPEGSKLEKTLRKRCDGPDLDLATLIPGCGTSEPADVVACVARHLRCRGCRAIDRADGLGTDCDVFDDDSDNASCGG